MKATFSFRPKKHQLASERHKPLTDKPDFQKYMEKYQGEDLIVDIRPKKKSGEKQQMYAYYRGPLMDVAVKAYEDAGWELMDKVKAHYKLQAECAKDFDINPEGKEEYYVISIGDMTKERLHKYISDCIFFLESKLNVNSIPDAEVYKNRESFGRSFKSVKFDQ